MTQITDNAKSTKTQITVDLEKKLVRNLLFAKIYMYTYLYSLQNVALLSVLKGETFSLRNFLPPKYCVVLQLLRLASCQTSSQQY